MSRVRKCSVGTGRVEYALCNHQENLYASAHKSHHAVETNQSIRHLMLVSRTMDREMLTVPAIPRRKTVRVEELAAPACNVAIWE